MPTVEYQLWDVFTDRPFAGNPLAVVIGGPALDDEQMQRMAQELNLSETVFLRPGSHGVETRIFTPGRELPFAGHPTIGAALALAQATVIDDSVTLLEGVGPVVVTISDGQATLTTAGPPTSVEVADPDDVVRCLGLSMSDLHPTLGPRGWSAGVPYTIVTLRDVETLGRCRLDLAWWGDTVAHSDAPELYVLAPVDARQRVDAQHWRARMFAPGVGVLEDPATGSAAAAACGYLAGHATPGRLDEGWTIEQGVEMGRPSTIHVGAVLRGAELVAATVGGRAVQVGRGELLL